MTVRTSFFIVVSVVLVSCDGGLEPIPPPEPGFAGTIRFISKTWPPPDSLINLWVFASQVYPLDSTSVLTGLFSQPQTIFLYPTDRDHVAINVDSASYEFPVPPATYRYIGVVQRFRSDFSVRSFRVVGFYIDPQNPGQPLAITVLEADRITGIDMTVDFQNPPVQPF
ncbi:MAG: hypothetical protein HY562_07575 [Ignavibacteriales bacterium]|nr:hypothetical protein [Ignavibacteriales bacterium]